MSFTHLTKIMIFTPDAKIFHWYLSMIHRRLLLNFWNSQWSTPLESIHYLPSWGLLKNIRKGKMDISKLQMRAMVHTRRYRSKEYVSTLSRLVFYATGWVGTWYEIPSPIHLCLCSRRPSRGECWLAHADCTRTRSLVSANLVINRGRLKHS